MVWLLIIELCSAGPRGGSGQMAPFLAFAQELRFDDLYQSHSYTRRAMAAGLSNPNPVVYQPSASSGEQCDPLVTEIFGKSLNFL